MKREDLRNVVIIAHVDHGKTTLVDCLLKQSGQFRDGQLQGERILDANDLEKERGITILAKNIAIPYEGVKINIIDTPGHADFGGEVERVVRMADGALVLVDAAEGPMPQTRYVLNKALEAGLEPIVVINKIDRPDARSAEVADEALELLLDLGAEEAIDDYAHIFATSKEGYATLDPTEATESMRPLLDLLLERIPPPDVDDDAPFQLLVTNIDWSAYIGRIAIGRVHAGVIKQGQQVTIMRDGEEHANAKVNSLSVFENLGKLEVESAEAGEIVAIAGIDDIEIGDTLCSVGRQDSLPTLSVDQPTLEMIFGVNSSPFAGREGQFVTTRQIRERLYRELERNVAMQVRPIDGSDSFAVAGRGVMHLSVLIETMRREGYELSVGKPTVVLKEIDGKLCEPYETLVVEVPADAIGPVMELVGVRRGELIEMTSRGSYSIASFSIPARGLIGLRTRVLNATRGSALLHHRFEKYAPLQGEIPKRPCGVLVSMCGGKAVGYALDGLQERAELFIAPGDEVYEGMIVGENSRSEDMIVNPTKEKKLTNIRAAGSDDNILLKPPKRHSLELALEYIEDDELLEVTPSILRFRKIQLREADRRRTNRNTKS